MSDTIFAILSRVQAGTPKGKGVFSKEKRLCLFLREGRILYGCHTGSFGSRIFDDRVMKAKLPAKSDPSLRHTIGETATPDLPAANTAAMKDWAVQNGAVHFTHWFQPLSDITAEKHDSFISPAPDADGGLAFSGKDLTQGEPDAASFPPDGPRTTVEARDHTVLDPIHSNQLFW